jgi:hypothetical protein
VSIVDSVRLCFGLEMVLNLLSGADDGRDGENEDGDGDGDGDIGIVKEVQCSCRMHELPRTPLPFTDPPRRRLVQSLYYTTSIQ